MSEVAEKTEKFCSKCRSMKPIGEFSFEKKSPDGHKRWCQSCSAGYWEEHRQKYKRSGNRLEKHRAQNALRYDANREKTKQQTARYYAAHKEQATSSLLKRNYGITLDDYRKMLTAQGGVCAICKRPPGRLRLAVDHDHITGKVRGLLCGGCNTALGGFREDTCVMIEAINYIKQHSSPQPIQIRETQ